MPTLTWPAKTGTNAPTPAALTLDSVFPPRVHAASPAGRLFLGDNLRILSTLQTEYSNRLDLIYADPPFFTNRKFPARVGRNEDSRKPAEWQLGEGYRDNWHSLDNYLQFLYERLQVMHSLLHERGTIYLHLDWHADAYARLLLDEIFGAENFLNEIIWAYHGPSPIRTAFNRKHDTILVYTKSPDYIFNVDDIRVPYDPTTVKTFASSKKAGFGKEPDLERGKVPEDWWYFPVVARLHNERTGYPTQKPEAMLERIIRASSNPGGIVGDFFCGSGTTPVVAARHGRSFLASDASPRAIHTTRQRLAAEGQGFSLEVDSAHAWRVLEGQNHFERRGNSLHITDADFAETLEAWEVDPDWDGKTFRNGDAAFRPARKGEMPRQLSWSESKTGRRICVRYVDVTGQVFQVEL